MTVRKEEYVFAFSVHREIGSIGLHYFVIQAHKKLNAT
jgi:hypothetical protein